MIINPYSLAPPFSPIDVADLKIWLKADAGIIIAGGAVQKWEDQSGFGFDFGAPATGQRPKFNGSYANGKPYVYCDGPSQQLQLAGFTQRYRTVFIACKFDLSHGGFNNLGVLYGQDSSPYCEVYYNKSGNNSYLVLTGNDVTVEAPLLTTPQVICIVLDVNYDAVYVNGVLMPTNTIDMTSNTSNHTILGAFGTYAIDGGITEYLNYNRVLTTQERNDVTAYLQSRI